VLGLCGEILIPKIVEYFNKNRDVIVFQERAKFQHIAEELVGEKPEISTSNFADYYRFSYNTEIKLAILNYYEIYIMKFEDIYDSHLDSILKTDQNDNNGLSISLSSFLRKFPLDAYNITTNNMVRLFELRLKSRLNRKIFICNFLIKSEKCKTLATELPRYCPLDKDDDLRFLYFNLKSYTDTSIIFSNDFFYLISDGIFCELKIIESIFSTYFNYLNITLISRGFFTWHRPICL